PEDLLSLLRNFALRNKTSTVDLRQFIASLPKGQMTPAEMGTALSSLAKKGTLKLSASEGKIRAVTFPDFSTAALQEEYKRLAVEPDLPFPSLDSFPVKVAEDELSTVDVKGNFATLLEDDESPHEGIVNVEFPDGVRSLIVPREVVSTVLIEAAAAKIARHLQDPKNASYAESKLGSVLRGNELVLRQALEDAISRPRKAASLILAPSDFQFRFWNHLTNLILQDFRGKENKTDADHGLCQSAFLIAYAVFHMKGASQRDQEKAADLKKLDGAVRRPPYIFGYQDLYELKDDKGTTYTAKHSRDFIHGFLKEKTQRSGNEDLPFLVRVHAAAQNKDYFIQRDFLVTVFLKKLTEGSEEIRQRYLDQWATALKEDNYPAAARNDAAFRRDVEVRVKEDLPLLSALANGSALFLAAELPGTPQAARTEVTRCFSVESILKPFDELLGLSRTQLLKDVRLFLPFWQTMPILSGIVRFFRRLGRRRKQTSEGAPPPTASARVVLGEPAPEMEEKAGAGPKEKGQKTNLLHYKRSIQALISHYVPMGKTIDVTLDELAEKWNPLYDPRAKKNLVEDVNALVRDFLRPIKRSFMVQPPDIKRIHALAEQLSTSKSLEKIKKREILKNYIELYMVRSLEVKSF
ncbi:MAG TPA: hypothetical protein VMM82_06635, partial [Spirochaetia bacterium]|nr:hypothetical protein [Spirochaetia bacterium]